MKIKLPLRKQKDKEIASDRENVNNDVSQKTYGKCESGKVTFDVFQEVLDKYLKEEITQQQEQVLYNYLLKQILRKMVN